jgi:NHL repeat
MTVRKPILVCALVLGVSLAPASASAKQVRGPITGVIGEGAGGHTGGSGNGELAGPSGVAIDQSSEDVYVVDRGNDRVEKYGEAGGYISQLNGGATPAGSFSEPTAVAVDQATGDVYVADTGHNVVDKFTSAGAYVCELSGVGRGCQASPAGPSTFSAPVGVAVDPTTGNPTSGDVYISDKENRVVDIFTALGADAGQFQPGPPPWGLAVDSAGDVFVAVADEGRIQEYSPGGASELGRIRGGERAVGVDLQSGDIFVGAERGGRGGPYGIEEFNPSREELGSFGFGAMSDPGIASPGIAVGSTSHAIYAADTERNVVDIFGLATIPDPTGCKASAITATTAKLTGEVNPRDTKAQSLFPYGTEHSYGLETPLELVDGGAEVETDVPVEATVTELAPGTTYHCRLDATNSTNIVNDGPDGTFETLPLAPVVEEIPAFASEVTTDSAILNGQVNPGNGPTSYHFAYGLQAGSYPNALPDVGTGTGFAAIPVEQALPHGSLEPATTYHFVLIATNAAETVVSADHTFTTLRAPAPPETAPVISTGPAIAITPNSAVLTGLVFPENTRTMYLFELGTSTAYGAQILGGEAGREGGLVPVSVAAANLQPGTVYHYRLLAVNAAGTSIGPDRTFTTATFPQQIFQPPTLGLVPIPVFPAVKNPTFKPPKKHHKHPHKKPKPKRAHGGRAARRHHGR